MTPVELSQSDIFVTLMIFLARVADVALGTLRATAVVQGKRLHAWWYAFFEVLIWILVVARVIEDLDRPHFILAFALGFATGTYVGITIEQKLAIGRRIIRIFTRHGREIAELLRKSNFIVTVFDGEGRDGAVQLLFIEARRRDRKTLLTLARSIDPTCYTVLDSSNVMGK